MKIPEFDNYGILLDRLNEIICNDSIAKIIIETDNTKRNIYPIEYCEIPMFHPRNRNTFFVYRDSICKNERKVSHSYLSKLMAENFENMDKNSDFADSPEKVLFIFEFYAKKSTNGIEEQLEIITKSFDQLKTSNELKIAFWSKTDLKKSTAK